MAKKGKQDSQEVFINLMNELDSGKLKPVYFLCGEEQFFTDQIQDKILSLVPPESKDFNYDLLYGQDVDPSKILDIARSYPMMGERRYLFVREFFQSLDKTFVPEGEEADADVGRAGLDAFIPYFEKPADFTVLVIHDFKKPNKNSRFYKALAASEKCGYYEFDSPAEHQIVQWITQWTQTKHNKQIDPKGAEILYQISGTNLHKLSTELDKICTFNKTAESISVKDVRSVVGFSREFSAFELQEALFQRDSKKTMFIAEQMLQNGSSDAGEIIRTIALLHNSFINMWQYKRLASRNLSNDQIAKLMSVNPYRLRFISRDAANFKNEEIPLVFETLLDADRAIKGYSKLDSKAIFVMMLKRIIA